MQDTFWDTQHIIKMENAEEVMQLLEEFSKVKPKEIPRELEDYLGYVAKTGDPVFQWSLMRNLLREKLLAVVTDFYESTLTVELPPCPNVEPFNYERMKTSLLERFDAFPGAPFTIQRICELLINPRKEYNRADKYMRAIEKNILVVSTREPGTGKRPLECDQTETVLNGMPDIKVSESDGGLLHVPSDLIPYLGAPPASNDVTVETTEPNSTIMDRMGQSINGDVTSVNSDSEKLCTPRDSQCSSNSQDEEQVSSRAELKKKGSPVKIQILTGIRPNRLFSSLVEARNAKTSSDTELDSGVTDSGSLEANSSVLPDSIDSSDTKLDHESQPTLKLESDEVVSDENEVSSSPADTPKEPTTTQEESNKAADSEAEATDSSHISESEVDGNLSPDSDTNIDDRVICDEGSKTISISEVTATKSEEVDLECNEISGTVISPASPENHSPPHQTDEVAEHNVNIELVEESEGSQPDSSNDPSFHSKQLSDASERCELGLGSEADSVSEVYVDKTSLASDQSSEIIVQEVTEELPTQKLTEDAPIEKSEQEPPQSSPDLTEEVSESLSRPTTSLNEDKLTTVSQPDVQSSSDSLVEMFDNERRDESVIQSIQDTVTPDSQDQITIEEISVDPSCEAVEEAMDVDDCSNQMMVSEGENEGEPMDEGDQLQS